MNVLILITLYVILILILVITILYHPNPTIDINEQLQLLRSKPIQYNMIPYKIYYINLDRSPERKFYMENQFSQFKLTNYQRISAVDGKQVDLSSYKSGYNYLFKQLNPYEKACTLSHLKAIETAYNNNEEIVLIMEDDCNLDLIRWWGEDLAQIVANAPIEWQVLQLFSLFSSTHLSKYSQAIIEGSSGAYLINRSGMKTLLDNFNSQQMKVADRFLYESTKSYLVAPNLFVPINIGLASTVGADRDDPHMEKIAILLRDFINL